MRSKPSQKELRGGEVIDRWSGDPRWRYIPHRYADGTEVMRPRSNGDCVRMSISVAYGFDYWELPDTDWEFTSARDCAERKDEFWGSWRRWAEGQGLYLWQRADLAPIFLPRWIAGVEVDGMPHAVAMTYNRLLDDPNATRPWERANHSSHSYLHVDLSWVRAATALLPADQPTIRGKFWRIGPQTQPKGITNAVDHLRI